MVSVFGSADGSVDDGFTAASAADMNFTVIFILLYITIHSGGSFSENGLGCPGIHTLHTLLAN